MNFFPRDLAKKVIQRWEHVVAGQYTAPPRPPDRLFRQLLETAYLASIVPDEDRFPQFNIVAVPEPDSEARYLGEVWKFDEPRKLSVDEFRKLAHAVDYKKSAILAHWKEGGWEVAGLTDLGTSWGRARAGLQYHYRFPASLFIQVDPPGRMKVYQGQYFVASLAEGKIDSSGFQLSLVLHTQAHNGLKKIWKEITYPKIEHPREFENFQFLAFWNVFAALVNSINEEGHGGAIVIVPADHPTIEKELRIKYRLNSSVLRNAFINFMNARHRIADVFEQIGSDPEKENELKGEYAIAELDLNQKYQNLVEPIRFLAKLSACDGAIVMTEELNLLGFGAEIRSELKPGTKVEQVIDDVRRVYKPLDVESFGLRHRSAIKLISRKPKCVVLVVSQDGAVSFVSSDQQNSVFVKRGVNLINMNMPWA